MVVGVVVVVAVVGVGRGDICVGGWECASVVVVDRRGGRNVLR